MTRGRTLSLVLPPFLWAAVIFALSSLPDLKSNLVPTWDLVLRKLAHAFEYAVLAVLFARIGIAERASMRWTLTVAFLATVAYALTDELHQLSVVGRQGRPADIGVDSIGAALGLALLVTRRQYRRPGDDRGAVAAAANPSPARQSGRRPAAPRPPAGRGPSGRARAARRGPER